MPSNPGNVRLAPASPRPLDHGKPEKFTLDWPSPPRRWSGRFSLNLRGNKREQLPALSQRASLYRTTGVLGRGCDGSWRRSNSPVIGRGDQTGVLQCKRYAVCTGLNTAKKRNWALITKIGSGSDPNGNLADENDSFVHGFDLWFGRGQMNPSDKL